MSIPHVILFADRNCSGDHYHVCEGFSNIESSFNDVTSSFIILEGSWKFFADAGPANQMGPDGGRTLGPGVYNWIEDPACLGPSTNDRLSALQPA